MRSKGFTLIELLVVVAIVAILAVVVVLTINPTELLRQGRDASRVSDMGTLNKAVSLYYQDAMNNPSTLFMGTSSVIYVSIPDTTTATSTAGDQCQGLGLPTAPTNFTYHCAASSTYTMTNGTGWIPINFNTYASSVTGAVISKLPVDPVNTTSTNLYYTYQTDGIGGFKVAAFFESQKDASLMTSDGGNDAELYEKGSNLALASGRGLIGYWPMNEGVGGISGVSQTADVSGNSNTGTWYGTAGGTNSTYYSAGKVGSWAGYFNGSNNYIDLGNSLNFSSDVQTESFWLVNKGTNKVAYILDRSSNSDVWGYHAIVYEGGTLKVSEGSNGGEHQTAITYANLNNGDYLCFVYNYPNVTVYRNGNFYTTLTFTQHFTTGSTYNTVIGRAAGFNNYYFDGIIDDVRIYNRTLSATEIQEMYNAEK
jgi:prepilin-type N-terminal cleavage/methylation domain-containing protein